MVYDDNEGHKYENKIAQELLEHGVIVKQVCTKCHKHEKFSSVQEKCPSCNIELRLNAGSGTQEDVTFRHNGKEFSIEIKNNPSDPDWGQCELLPTFKDGKCTWNFSNEAKEKRPKLIEYYGEYKFNDGTTGLLPYLNNKKLMPHKFRIPDEDLTIFTRREDRRAFEDRKHKISTRAFADFHDKKSDYVQIGKGYGFYHINNDSANLDTEQFDGEFTLRFRCKANNTHFPRCPKCDKECNPGRKDKVKCKSCKIKIPKGKDIGHKCEVCSKHATKQEGRDKIVEYAKFNHRDDVVEYVVLICDPKIKKKSNLDLDKKYGQDFPLIHS